MKTSFTTEEVLFILEQDEIDNPCEDMCTEEIQTLHHSLADLITKGLIEMTFDDEGRPVFKNTMFKPIPIRIPLTITTEMLN